MAGELVTGSLFYGLRALRAYSRLSLEFDRLDLRLRTITWHGLDRP